MSNSEPIVQVHKIKRPGQNRKIVNALITIIIFAVLGCGAYLFLKPKDKKIKLLNYDSTLVSLMDLENTLSLSGEIDIRNRDSILSPYDGVCTSILARSGDSVIKGEILIKLSSPKLIEDRDKLQTELKKLKRSVLATDLQYKREKRLKETSIKKYKRLLTRAENEYEKALKLYDFNSLTLKELTESEDKKIDSLEIYDNSLTELKNLEEDYINDKILLDYDIKDIDIQLSKNSSLISALDVKSPISGTILDISIKEGELITKHSPLLQVGDLSTPFVKLNIPEKNRSQIEQDQDVILKVGKKNYKAKLTQINAIAIQSSKGGPVITAEAEFTETPPSLVPGSNCGAEIIMNTNKDALTLPRGPYIISGKDKYLYRVEGDKAYRVEVVFGTLNSSHISVSEGIKLGDEIITSSYSEYINKEIIYLDMENRE